MNYSLKGLDKVALPRRQTIIHYFLAILLIILTSVFVHRAPVYADEGDEGIPDRRVITKVADNGYLWLLMTWANSEIQCEILIDHPRLPTWGEVSVSCGDELFEEWRETRPCTSASINGDTSSCKGLYILYAGFLEGERTVVTELPVPTITISLEGCERDNLSYICTGDPALLLLADEPLPDHQITSVHADVADDSVDCEGSECRIPLIPYKDEVFKFSFWADSSYGDESEVFRALVRAAPLPWQARPGSEYWQVDVLSPQWTGAPSAACALTWESFPPVDLNLAWLETPEDSLGLETDQPLELLAGRLLSWGLVQASDCPLEGLLLDGTASQCGIEATRDAVNDWQDRFDVRIYNVSTAKGLSPQLLKRIFAQESQFWPGIFPDIVEYGLGGLHPEGGDALLLWNNAYYQAICTEVLSEEVCENAYHELSSEDQEMLKGALAVQADVRCSDCPTGIDIEKADLSVDLFANLILANCAQTGQVLRNIARSEPGEVASYPNLWRFTLVNYHSGPGCLSEALSQVYRTQDTFDWYHVSRALSGFEACSSAVDYVKSITSP